MSSSDNGQRANQSNRGTNSHANRNNNKKKDDFKGDVDGFTKVLTMPSERGRGVASQFEDFMAALRYYAGREASPKNATARIWAQDYISQKDPAWEPPFPLEPQQPNKTGVNNVDKAAVLSYKV